MEIEQSIWGFTAEGEAIVLYTLRNASGASVALTNLGAAIVSATVPDRNGRLGDVALGYEEPLSYMGDGAAMGKIAGRYANRIANGAFSLDGREYRLPRNNGPNHLHGGPGGFANRMWESRVETDRVVFALVSAAGDQGYPGELGVEVVYDWDDDGTLEITMFAECDAPTIVNLTNHAYFNLSGHSAGSVLGHRLTLAAESYLPTDNTQIPTGEIAPVAGTPMDFRSAKEIGRDIELDFPALKIGKGYDHCWVADGYQKGKVRPVARLCDPLSGRTLDISTSQPGVQVYTGNYLYGTPMAKGGGYYGDRAGVAIECQGFPDAPNHPEFPSQTLRPGETYRESIIYRFGTDK